MMLSDDNLSDEELLAFADGALDAQESAAVQDRIAKDQNAQTRLNLLRLSGTALVDARAHDLDGDGVARHAAFVRNFGQAVSEAARLDDSTGPSGDSPGRWFGHGWRIAAAVVLFAGGTVAGIAVDRWQAPAGTEMVSDIAAPGMSSAKPEKPDMASTTPGADMESGVPAAGKAGDMGGWIASVVAYQNLYVRATVETAPRPDAGSISAFEKRLGAALGTGLAIPDLDGAGLEFRRGQILAFDKRPLVQLAYLPEGQGRPVALCIMAMTGKIRTPAYSKRQNTGVVRWSDGKLDYVLVGWQSEAQLLKAADLAIARLNRI